MLKTFKYFNTILAISFLLTACSQKVVVEKPTILEVKQDTIVEQQRQLNALQIEKAQKDLTATTGKNYKATDISLSN